MSSRAQALLCAAAMACALALTGHVLVEPAGAVPQATSSATIVLKKGKRGSRVAALQRKLGIPADGVFGRGTKRAVKRFQRRNGLFADGIAGPQTLGALGLRSSSSRSPSRRRSTSGSRRGGKSVRSLQRSLGVAADGVFGLQTEQAVRAFQRSRGLTADGVVGPQTRVALGLGSGPVLKRRGSAGGGSRADRLIARMRAAGNRIADHPYRYGGGHGSYRDSGYDCSGSVSYVLHGAGLLRTPLDSSGLMSYGRPGRGRRVTIYAHAGHAYMVIDGRRFDTSALRPNGSRWTSEPRSPSGYVARHPPGL